VLSFEDLAFFFLMAKYIIYKRIKSQVLHQEEKIKTTKTLKEKPPAPWKCWNPDNSSSKNQHRQLWSIRHPIEILFHTFSFDHHSSFGLSEEISQQPRSTCVTKLLPTSNQKRSAHKTPDTSQKGIPQLTNHQNKR